MGSAAEKKTTSKKIGYLRLAMVSSTTAVIVVLGIGVAYANAPSAGQPCSVRNATTRDTNGRTMWCNPMMTGTHGLVWQYAPGS